MAGKDGARILIFDESSKFIFINSVHQKTLHQIENNEQSFDIFKRRNFGSGGLTGSKVNIAAKYHKSAKSSLDRMT